MPSFDGMENLGFLAQACDKPGMFAFAEVPGGIGPLSPSSIPAADVPQVFAHDLPARTTSAGAHGAASSLILLLFRAHCSS